MYNCVSVATCLEASLIGSHSTSGYIGLVYVKWDWRVKDTGGAVNLKCTASYWSFCLIGHI